MACGAIKRSLEWDPLNSPSQSSTPVVSSARPTKKRCLVHHNYNTTAYSGPKEASPFADLHPKLSPETIAANIKDEMKRLQNRKQLYYSSSGNQFMLNSPNPENNSNENEASTSTEGQSLNSSFLGLLSPSRRDQPLFTFRQVTIICERLLKERETSLREEYDRVLSSKLAEQYDTFVKFTYDQIQKRFENGTTPSYLS
ncbi:akirin-2-like [Panonychus citri]|uniref:akirin-2-like n=1 Tax=Panonychus citri TaxID=50023 RepID=UPI00230826EB|nr:akirin-2-like [Panonychus citri]